MKTLIEYIYNKPHFNNIIVEELGEYKETIHANKRKISTSDDFSQFSNNLGNIKKSEIIDILDKADDLIVNALLNNKFVLNDSSSRYAIRKNDGNTWIMIIGYITSFDRETLVYDTVVVTVDRFNYSPHLKDYVVGAEIIGKQLKILK